MKTVQKLFPPASGAIIVVQVVSLALKAIHIFAEEGDGAHWLEFVLWLVLAAMWIGYVVVLHRHWKRLGTMARGGETVMGAASNGIQLKRALVYGSIIQIFVLALAIEGTPLLSRANYAVIVPLVQLFAAYVSYTAQVQCLWWNRSSFAYGIKVRPWREVEFSFPLQDEGSVKRAVEFSIDGRSHGIFLSADEQQELQALIALDKN